MWVYWRRRWGGIGWILGLLVIDRQRSSAELPNNGSPVFSPNSVGRVKLEFHLVYLALRVGMSYDTFSLEFLSRSAKEREIKLPKHMWLLLPPMAPVGLCW